MFYALHHKLDAILSNQRAILDQLHNLYRQGDRIMATLQDVQAAVAAEDTVIDSAIVLIKGLADKVAALAPNQAAIDALAAEIKGKSDALAAAVTENTPVETP